MGIDSSDLRLWRPASTALDASRLWVDDVREPPDSSWATTTSSAQAIAYLVGHVVVEVSLDHDLGGDDTTRPVVRWMAQYDRWPPVVRVHTANPVGREWLVGMIQRYGPGVAA